MNKISRAEGADLSAGRTAAPTPFTRVKRLAKRACYDRDTIYAVLDAAAFCHIGHVIDGRPVVTPTFHWRHGDTLFWHGSSASRMVRANKAGGEICLTATIMDAWVLARSAFNHSANYRSVMCFGTPIPVTDPDEKLAALRGFVERRFPGRWDELRPVKEKELKATSVLSMPIDEASAKVRATGVDDDPNDLAWQVWAGLLPVTTVNGDPIPDVGVGAQFSPPEKW